jgi:hypothetical protein
MNSPLARFALWGGLIFAGERSLLALRTPSAGVEGTAFLRTRVGAEAGFLSPDDALLYREAIDQGLYDSDPVVHRRLVENLRFLGVGAGESEAAVARDAIALGLHRTDLVVQRRLVNVMRLRLEQPARKAEPTDEELRAELAAHPERWREPARVSLVHVFLSRERRGAALDLDAERILRALRTHGAPSEDATQLGDAFPEPLGDAPLSQSELERMVGPRAASAAFAAPAGRWSNPVHSALGAHLFFVHEKTEAHAPPLDAVRAAVRESVLAERAERALERAMAELRAKAPPDDGGSGG